MVQSTCREILAHADRFRFDGEGRFRQWLFTTALRKITDRKRYYLAGKRRADRDARAPSAITASEAQIAERYATALTSPSGAAIRREEVERLGAALGRLSDADREIIALARVAELPHAEIARTLGITAGAVRVRLSRALVRLAALMRPEERKNRT